MDSLITAAAHALAAGDPLGALNRIALREDASALALRGIAMAQLGDFPRARALLKAATRAFGAKATLARSRCIVAEAEIALASRDLAWPAKALDHARATLEAHGDRVNAAHARYLDVRRALLIGRLDAADRMLAELDPDTLPATLRTAHELMSAGIAMRRLHTRTARAALERATHAAREARIPPLAAEVDNAWRILHAPAARLIADGRERTLLLDEVEALLASHAFVVDACRLCVRENGATIALATRPVLFTLARLLAQAWPGDAPRDALILRAFRLREADETHRARLRVEIGRLRTMLSAHARIDATPRGFRLAPHHAREVAVLTPPVEDEYAPLLACLADGESWSSSALAIALGASQRTVQRSLDALAQSGKVQSFGRGRARRWTTPPMPGFTTALLLPVEFAGD
ncbi:MULTISPECIES: helix-turn-helix domain-containing protein [unclassified Caballeronia]|uniref:helix-turn-helix domain-containing protein n=1 Tax=unclassified Caballeronia TaxID=2646786 RepID=UPI001F164F61|nr:MULTISPECIES: helix-turn-helix domain-containing protein [unclassified Caballeronia]MCE4546534.1 helix-turn-helix domain-containing protein [Caballeronia sp. PC1]MCE4572993.1 helix-turn-helix domain-containing protein [Caballeronia sp. CLC5]